MTLHYPLDSSTIGDLVMRDGGSRKGAQPQCLERPILDGSRAPFRSREGALLLLNGRFGHLVFLHAKILHQPFVQFLECIDMFI
jgi:hypothetical protein